MHFYQKNIPDFNNATRHLTRVERSLFSDAIELYYDTEKPLTSDFERLAKLLLARTEEEKTALKDVLSEFFNLTDDGYFNKRCNEEIKKYHAYLDGKRKAGKASAEQRKGKESDEWQEESTDVEQTLNTCSTDEQLTNNSKPITNNQGPITTSNVINITSAKVDIAPKAKVEDWEDVFRFWKTTLKHERAVIDDKRKKIIRDALKSFSVEDLKLAIIGCSLTPHNMGVNDRNEIYDKVALIFRDADQIERFIRNANNPPKPQRKNNASATYKLTTADIYADF